MSMKLSSTAQPLVIAAAITFSCNHPREGSSQQPVDSALRDSKVQHDSIPLRNRVTLREAHVGDLEIDTRLLDSYNALPEHKRIFYLDSRTILRDNPDADLTDKRILQSAQDNNMPLMGGPMLGRLSKEGVVLWMRPSSEKGVSVKVRPAEGGRTRVYRQKPIRPGEVVRMEVDELEPATSYEYTLQIKRQKIAGGSFRTAPSQGQSANSQKSANSLQSANSQNSANSRQSANSQNSANSLHSQDGGDDQEFRLAFGSCFHKIGLHNPNLIAQILERKPGAMMLLGDIAVDDRENSINMHRADYLLRDVSAAWSDLAANVPLYTTWDDHDYLNNDLSGIPKGFTEADKQALRDIWRENWNNPANAGEGIYFNTRVGPVEIIMLDTRSCRTVEKRRQYGSYLGRQQMAWLKESLRSSTAPFKVISSGTMWSDYISNGKDSWGSWDVQARQEIFDLIEAENISGVILISGDRHGARGFTIPVSSGFVLHEFEAASLGGVPGPEAIAKDSSQQLFGYAGAGLKAFGEFTFHSGGDSSGGDSSGGDSSGSDSSGSDSSGGDSSGVTFRLIDESGTILEEHRIPYTRLTP